MEAKEKRVTRHELRHDRHTVLLLTDQISTEKTNFKETAFPGEKSVSAVEGKIDICVKDMPLVDLAIFIDNIQPIEIAIPASRAYESISFDLKETTVENVIKSAGLMPV